MQRQRSLHADPDGSVAEGAIPELTYREAIRVALEDEMVEDDRVLLLGEDVADAGGVFKTSEGLLERFGPDRVLDTPIAENCFVGVGVGLAVTGFRPVVEIMFADFLAVAMDAIVNEAAKYRFMSGGKFAVPLTIRAIGGGLGRFGAQHSQTAESWFAGVPGLQVVAAGSPADAYGLLRSAVQDPNPVLFLEHKAMYQKKGPVLRGKAGIVPLATARVLREGSQLTLIGSLLMADRCAAAAVQLAEQGFDVEVIDLRSIWPLDEVAIARSVEKTGRLVTVEEQTAVAGWGGSVIARLVEEGIAFRARPRRVTLPDIPMPYSPVLEDAFVPSLDRIIGNAIEVITS